MKGSLQTYTRIIGVLFLVSLIGGGLGEFYIPGRILVPGDAQATAVSVAASSFLYRAAFAMYLLEAIADVTLTVMFYFLLRPVNRDIALLAAFFGIISTTLFAGGELFYFAASQVFSAPDYLKTFTPEQIASLGMLWLKMYGTSAGIFMVFYGIATGLRGYLVYRSGFLPGSLGVIMMIAGAGFIVRNFLLVLMPAYASDLFLAPMFIASLSLTLWFLIKGVDESKWRAKAGVQ